MKMPPKKRDKDDGSKNLISRDIQVEHELFLQAFEKPTQIYRYLRTRNEISPIFLNRTLTYMKHRMSRNHKRRTEFKVDSMLTEKLNKIRQDRNLGSGNYMSLMFIGYYDKTCIDFMVNHNVRVETVLFKISHKKRKDSSSPLTQESFGTSEVIVNPKEETNENDKIPAVSIPTESFITLNGTPHNHSYTLLLKVATIPKLIVSEDNGEPCSKRQKTNTTPKFYGSELIIFDKFGRCLLAEGEYELALSEVIPTTTKNLSPKKHASWEIIPDNMNFEIHDKFDKCPTLKFYLKWTNESCTGYVNKPKPILLTPSLNDEASLQTIDTENIENNLGNNHNNNNSISSNNRNNSLAIIRFNNNNNNNRNRSSSQLVERVQTVYQFIYNNNSRQQTAPCDDMHCPWCSLDCMNLYSLLKHLKLCHARFTFTYAPVTNGARIDVAINDMYDGSYTGSPHDLVGPAGCAFARGGPVRRTTVTNLLVCRPRRQKPSLTEFIELDENELNNQRPYITGHNRLYHHTETCLPVHPKELDIDSEGESDPLWLQHKTMQMIDEFTDVNEGEKELMKMWNLHVMKHGYVGDCQLPIACDMFLDMRGHELLKKNLYRNFILHMCSLFDYGLVSPEVVYKTIQKLQNILSTYQEGRKIMAESREAQLDYWLKHGIQKQAQQDELKQKQQRELKEKQNDGKASSSSFSSLSSSPLETGEMNNKKNFIEQKERSSSKEFNKNTQQSTTTSLQRKRSLNNIQSEVMNTSKRRLSQLRESPPRRRSVPSSDQQQQQNQQQQSTKTIPPRRKSVALVNVTSIDHKINSNTNNSSSSPTTTPNQSTMRKRITSIAKVDKH